MAEAGRVILHRLLGYGFESHKVLHAFFSSFVLADQLRRLLGPFGAGIPKMTTFVIYEYLYFLVC